ncbi:hypothetical protein [Tropicimonas sp. S265A]|uniref:hypothetical protein n=1 Tax=Tropicimonas sp. S265A TaxID=3415134 RepID=UPI003C7D9B30
MSALHETLGQNRHGRHEYFDKEEVKGAPLPIRLWLDGRRGDFSFGGHRLSSLYRMLKVHVLRLTAAFFASSLQKYSKYKPSSGATKGADA